MAVLECVSRVAERVRLHLMERILADIYNFGSGKRTYYHGGTKTPTYQFYHSIENNITARTESLVEHTITSNASKMNYDGENFLHGSNRDARESLMEILGQNKTGSLFGNGWWRYRPNFWDTTITELENGLIDKWFREELQKIGLSLRF